MCNAQIDYLCVFIVNGVNLIQKQMINIILPYYSIFDKGSNSYICYYVTKREKYF